MSQKISRRKLSNYAAKKIIDGGSIAGVLSEIAAYLVDTGRVREADLLVRDIEAALLKNSFAIATVTTAIPISGEIRKQIQKIIGSDKLVIKDNIDQTVIAGICIDVPGKRYDGTVKHKLNALKANKL